MTCKTIKNDNYTIQIFYDYYRNMYIGKFINIPVPNVYGDTEKEIYDEIEEAIHRYEDLNKI